MKRKVLVIILSIISLVVGGGYLGYKYLKSPTFIATLIRDNIKNYSIVLVKNDQRLIDKNSSVLRPLASTVKIIIAIEYAEQVAAQKISEEEPVSLAELEKYYVANTDGGAHPDWLEHLKKEGLIHNGATTLGQVAYGMIRFSSNANTEFLMDKLGIENVNNRIAQLGLPQHEKIFYLVSALFLKDKLDKLHEEELYFACTDIHNKLKQGETFQYVQASDETSELARQKKLSDRLPAATANEYYAIMSRINRKDYFDPAAQEVLERLLGWPMEHKKNESWAKRIGLKGGSTAWVYNNAMYVERNNGDRYEFIMFSDQPSHSNDNFLIQEVMGKFLLAIFTDPVKSAKLIQIINN